VECLNDSFGEGVVNCLGGGLRRRLAEGASRMMEGALRNGEERRGENRISFAKVGRQIFGCIGMHFLYINIFPRDT